MSAKASRTAPFFFWLMTVKTRAMDLRTTLLQVDMRSAVGQGCVQWATSEMGDSLPPPPHARTQTSLPNSHHAPTPRCSKPVSLQTTIRLSSAFEPPPEDRHHGHARYLLRLTRPDVACHAALSTRGRAQAREGARELAGESSHFRELGRGAAGDLGHAELLKLGLELIKLAQELLPTLLAELVSLDLDCAQPAHNTDQTQSHLPLLIFRTFETASGVRTRRRTPNSRCSQPDPGRQLPTHVRHSAPLPPLPACIMWKQYRSTHTRYGPVDLRAAPGLLPGGEYQVPARRPSACWHQRVAHGKRTAR